MKAESSRQEDGQVQRPLRGGSEPAVGGWVVGWGGGRRRSLDGVTFKSGKRKVVQVRVRGQRGLIMQGLGDGRKRVRTGVAREATAKFDQGKGLA